MVDQDGSMTKLPREVVARHDVAIGINLPRMTRFTARPVVSIGVGDTVAPSKAQIHGKIHSSQTLAIDHDFDDVGLEDVGLDDVGLDHERR